MNIIPKSIANKRTLALDDVWAARLSLLKSASRRLLLNIDALNGQELDLFFEQLGVPSGLFDLSAVTDRKAFIAKNMEIFRYSGTERSVRLMVELLGFSYSKMNIEYSLGYNSEAKYDGLYHYDAGSEYRHQVVILEVSAGVSGTIIDEITSRSQLFRAWEVFQPLKLYLRDVTFS